MRKLRIAFPRMLISVRAKTTSLKAHTVLSSQHKGFDLWREQVQGKCLLGGPFGRGSAACGRRDIHGTTRAAPESIWGPGSSNLVVGRMPWVLF